MQLALLRQWKHHGTLRVRSWSSCAATNFCIAVDTGGGVLTFNGSTWTAPDIIDPTYQHLWSVSCPSRTFCAAVDTSSNIFTFNGTTWTEGKPAPTGGKGLEAVSCPNSATCMANGFNGEVFTYTNAKWTVSAQTKQGDNLTGLSCPVTHYCVTVSSKGYALTGT
jgi:hypothetical protein